MLFHPASTYVTACLFFVCFKLSIRLLKVMLLDILEVFGFTIEVLTYLAIRDEPLS